MQQKIFFSFPENKEMGNKIAKLCNGEIGEMELRSYPNGESYIRVLSEVKDKEVVIICSMDNPNNKIISILFLTDSMRNLGAKKITLIAPYLCYMRHDKIFKPGETITSKVFAGMISNYIDELITIDPHLHRHKSLDEIYTVPSQLVHAAEGISEFIKDNIQDPILIGPDEESKQWVEDISARINCPFTVLKKTRYGDRNVVVKKTEDVDFKKYSPVLVDDIISTAHTMAETVKYVKEVSDQAPTVIGVHALFSGDAEEVLKRAGVAQVATCNTVTHHTNKIDLSIYLAKLFM